jgi:hypothetical protein
MVNEVLDEDIKRILIERDITTLKQACCRIMCAEIHNNQTRIFVPSKLFSQTRLKDYMLNKELKLGRRMLESEDENVYNRMVNLIVQELVNDGTVIKEKGTTADDSQEKYQATQNLDRICKEYRDSGLSF